MTFTLEELEKRLLALEWEVASLRQQQLQQTPISAGPPYYGSQMLREARATQPLIDAADKEFWSRMGIAAEPVPPEKLRQMMIEGGVRPEDNAASREIIAMREE